MKIKWKPKEKLCDEIVLQEKKDKYDFSYKNSSKNLEEIKQSTFNFFTQLKEKSSTWLEAHPEVKQWLMKIKDGVKKIWQGAVQIWKQWVEKTKQYLKEHPEIWQKANEVKYKIQNFFSK